MSLGSCAEGHRKSTYHFMNLNYTTMIRYDNLMQAVTCLLTLACYLYIYLIDRQCSGANWPHLSCHSSPPIYSLWLVICISI